jgi:putative salt-induced outer membrane protein
LREEHVSVIKRLATHSISPLCAGLLLIAAPAQSEEWGDEGWTGFAEVGAVLTTGNTDTETINAKTRVRHEKVTWRHTTQLEVLRRSEQGGTTAERYLGNFKSDWKFRPRAYLFGVARHERDRFSGYDYQSSVSAGYGHRVVDTDRTRLEMEAGAGYRQSRLEDGERDEEAIARGALALEHHITETARFGQDVLVQSGGDNSEVESVTSVSAAINAKLAMRLTLTAKHNTDVPDDREKTDTITAVSLVYNFW